MRIPIIAFALSVLALASGCAEKNPVEPTDDHEIITTVRLEFVSATGDTTIAVWQDSDGPGGNDPDRIDTISLMSGVVHTGHVKVYNASVTPAEDLTPSIESEKEQHQFLFRDDSGMLVVLPTDTDALGKPVGLQFTASATASGSGVLKVMLYHYDNASDKVPNSPGSETDISVEFPYVLQ